MASSSNQVAIVERNAKRPRGIGMASSDFVHTLLDKHQEFISTMRAIVEDKSSPVVPTIPFTKISESVLTSGRVERMKYPGAQPIYAALTADFAASIADLGELFYYKALNKHGAVHMVAKIVAMWMKLYVREHTCHVEEFRRYTFYEHESNVIAAAWLSTIEKLRANPDTVITRPLSLEIGLSVATNCKEIKNINYTTGELY